MVELCCQVILVGNELNRRTSVRSSAQKRLKSFSSCYAELAETMCACRQPREITIKYRYLDNRRRIFRITVAKIQVVRCTVDVKCDHGLRHGLQHATRLPWVQLTVSETKGKVN